MVGGASPLTDSSIAATSAGSSDSSPSGSIGSDLSAIALSPPRSGPVLSLARTRGPRQSARSGSLRGRRMDELAAVLPGAGAVRNIGGRQRGRCQDRERQVRGAPLEDVGEDQESEEERRPLPRPIRSEDQLVAAEEEPCPGHQRDVPRDDRQEEPHRKVPRQ